MKSDKLKRTIGVISATSIGLGAMLGAGIFIFPGLAGGNAGFAAIFSFLIGGIIAFAVASCTAELATAMPNSGGGYFFISRTFGDFWGTLVGISQWIGLVFACAFYLVSFAEYAFSLLEEFNINWNTNKTVLSFSFTLLLLIINVSGTKKVGRFQNIMVITLTIILSLIFSYGIIDYFGLKSKPAAFEKIVPNGISSIFTTAALVFTSYLGFVQIANVGAEIKKPGKNMPRALIGSVALATTLYIFILAVCTSTFPQEELKMLGETATIEVARELLGTWGAIIVVFAGLLAALSSANASMISASRGVFAMSNDNFISEKANKVNKRFGTPHIALIFVALPVTIMVFRSELEVFAEVASFLHLIIYAGICITLLKLRSKNRTWYAPTFKVPAVKIIAGFGAVSCLILILFMQKSSILISVGVLVLATIYYFLYVRNKEIRLQTPHPPKIDSRLISPKVLIPIDISRGKKELPQAMLGAIPNSELLILGFKKTPEQTEPEQSEKEFKEEASKILENIQRQLVDSKIELDSELLFSNNTAEQLRIAINEKELEFVLILKRLTDFDKFIIPIYDLSQINKQLGTVIYKLRSNNSKKINLIFFVKEKDDPSKKASLQQAMQKQLKALDISLNDFEFQTLEKVSTKKLLQEISNQNGLIVWSEVDTSERSIFLNMILKENSKGYPSPIMIILKRNK